MADSKAAHSHKLVTGLSGNEIYCLNKIGLQPGTLVVGNCVLSMGLIGGITSGLKTLGGGEVPEITSIIHEGRMKSVARMNQESEGTDGIGVTGVNTQLIIHSNNIEFLTIGSAVHSSEPTSRAKHFSSSSDGQGLYCQVDSGFQPLEYVFGNVAYSIGVGGGIGGFIKSMTRGEIPQFTEVFDKTRHLALARISDEAKKAGANAVVGIQTTVTSLMGATEMMMMGTAASHPALTKYAETPVTSDMTNEETWNMVNQGYLPIRLVMGVSVFSLGITGGIKTSLAAFAKGELSDLSSLLYEARGKALDRVQRDAERWGADKVVGVKIHIFELGGGIVEFFALGTAVKKIEGLTTRSQTLPSQAVIIDKPTYFQSVHGSSLAGKRESAKTVMGPIKLIVTVAAIVFAIIAKFMGFSH